MPESELFPEAFARFEKDNPDAKHSRNFEALHQQIAYWSSTRWIDSAKQMRALAVEARKLGIGERWKTAHFTRRGKPATARRDIISGRFVKSERR